MQPVYEILKTWGGIVRFMLHLIGNFFLILIGLIMWGVTIYATLSSLEYGVIAFSAASVLGIFIGIPAGRGLFRLGLRHMRPAIDPSKLIHFVLYLRPFNEKMTDSQGWLFKKNSFLAVIFYLSRNATDRFEESLASAVKPHTRLVGLSPPTQKTPELGATKIPPIQDPKWIDQVSTLSKKAQLILVMPASTHGLLQEMNMLLSNVEAQKVVILLPPPQNRNLEFESEWKAFAYLLKETEDDVGSALGKMNIDNLAGVWFAPGWKPQPVPIIDGSLETGADYVRALQHASRQRHKELPR